MKFAPRTCETCKGSFLQVNHHQTTIQRYCHVKCLRVSPETRIKISKTMTGRIAGHRGKSLPHRQGANCHFWKGGVSKINRPARSNFQSSLEYRNFRREVLARDNYTCVLCGDHSYKNRTGGHCYLHLDHIKPWALYPELRLDMSNARTLCRDCHYKTPTYGGVKLYRHLQGKTKAPCG